MGNEWRDTRFSRRTESLGWLFLEKWNKYDSSSKTLEDNLNQKANKENREDYNSFCHAMTGISLQCGTPEKENGKDVIILPQDWEDGDFTSSFI